MQEETRTSLLNIVKKLSEDLSDGELLDCFIENSDEQTFTNVIAGLSNSTTKLDNEIRKVINKLQAEIDKIISYIEQYDELNDAKKCEWTNMLKMFIQYVEIAGYGCRKNSNDNGYTIYSKLSIEGLNND